MSHPAEAARISCRFALVNSESTAEKISVETRSTPMHMILARLVFRVTERWYKSQIGTTRRTRIMNVMIIVTKALIRALV